jgi:hypothetical protein
MNQLLKATLLRAEQISALDIITTATGLDAVLTALIPRSYLLTRLRIQAVAPLHSNIALNHIPGHIVSVAMNLPGLKSAPVCPDHHVAIGDSLQQVL